MAKAKKQVKKLQKKKLEDRIAPGMVGGGIVDPGMAEAIDVGGDGNYDANAGEISETQYEGDSYQGDGSEGQYLDEANQGDDINAEHNDEYNDHDQESEEFNKEMSAEGDYDEFAQDQHEGGDFVEEPGSWQEPDWVTAHADGSYDITPPEGVSIDEGIANFPVEAANEALPLPDDVQINNDGSMTMQMPEGTQFVEEANAVIFPEGAVNLDEVPEGLQAHETPEGSLMVSLPDDGFEYDAESNSMNVDNYYANEFTPDNVEINMDGSVDVTLPEDGVEYNDDGSVHMSAEAGQMMDNPAPEYVGEMEYAEPNLDGSVTFEVPEGIEVEGGIAEIPHDQINELPIPEDMNFNADGTSNIGLPEGAEYNEAVGGIVMPEGEINLDEVPEGIDAHINPDGSTTVMLGEGMEYDADSHSVHLDNYWTNEITPDNVHYDADGSMQVALPEGTEFYDDGSFTIPSEQTDFVNQDAPEFIHDVEYSEPLADGGYQVNPPAEFELNQQEGELHISNEHIADHVPLDEGIEFNADGSMNVQMPEGTDYNPELNTLTFPEGSMNINEVPEQVNPVLNDDGSITAQLQDGMNYEDGQVQLDNYWANELTPEPIEVGMDGSLNIDLPQDVEYHADGSFTVPEYQADFLENPDPGYVAQGPEWIDMNPDGSLQVENFEQIEVNPEAGQLSMEIDYAAEQFDNYIPDEVQLNSDGTVNVGMPQGTEFNADANSLTFPEGSMHLDEIPEQVNAELNADGSITAYLQDGMDFDADANSVHLDNYWSNELAPEPVEFSPEGHVHVDLPHDAHYYDDGSFHIPEGSVDFMENPHPDYVDHGPDWVSDNPDGSVTVQAPEGAMLDPQAGTLSFSAEMAMQELGGDLIPEEIQLNADGTANIGLPEGAEFNADSNSISFAPGSMHMHELPEGVDAQLHADGSIEVVLPEGANYIEGDNAVQFSNEMINEMAPEPINITADGQFQIQLPEDTQYFEDGSFVISSDSADFLDDGGEHHHHEGQHQNYNQAA